MNSFVHSAIFLQAFAQCFAVATGFMGVVVAIALMVGKVPNATYAILSVSLRIAPSMAGVERGFASAILDGLESIAKHVSIVQNQPFFSLTKCLVCMGAFADEALVTEKV